MTGNRSPAPRAARSRGRLEEEGGWATLAHGLGFTESPIWTASGRLVLVSVSRGRVFEAFTDGRPPAVVAETGGGPNGLAEDGDGALWIAQNGATAMPSRSLLPAQPSLQVLAPERDDAQTFLAGPFTAPSDCVIGPDGRLWVTDPRDHRLDAGAARGRVWAVDRATGDAELIAADVFFPNGLAFGLDERLYVAESARARIVRYSRNGDGWARDRWAVDIPGGVPDGLAVDPRGCIWVAGSFSDSLFRLSPGGRVLDELRLQPKSLPTAICFAGRDSELLVVTAARGGRVLARPAPAAARRA